METFKYANSMPLSGTVEINFAIIYRIIFCEVPTVFQVSGNCLMTNPSNFPFNLISLKLKWKGSVVLEIWRVVGLDTIKEKIRRRGENKGKMSPEVKLMWVWSKSYAGPSNIPFSIEISMPGLQKSRARGNPFPLLCPPSLVRPGHNHFTRNSRFLLNWIDN